MQNVVGQRHQHDVGAYHASHHYGVRNPQCPNQRLPPQIREAFLHVGVDG